MEESNAPSFNELTIEDIARSQDRHRQLKIERRAVDKVGTKFEAYNPMKVAKIIVGAFAGASIAVIGASIAFSNALQVASQPTITPSTEIVKPMLSEESEDELLKARCLGGEVHPGWWVSRGCEEVTGMSYIVFEDWYDKNHPEEN